MSKSLDPFSSTAESSVGLFGKSRNTCMKRVQNYSGYDKMSDMAVTQSSEMQMAEQCYIPWARFGLAPGKSER